MPPKRPAWLDVKGPCITCGEPAVIWCEYLGPWHAECVPDTWFRMKGWQSRERSDFALRVAERQVQNSASV